MREPLNVMMSVILLAVVMLTSVMQFHSHDCQGHITFNGDLECGNAHIHLYSGDDNNNCRHNEQCSLNLDSQAAKSVRIELDPLPTLLLAILPSFSNLVIDLDEYIFIIDDFAPGLIKDRFGLDFHLRAPPVHFV